MLSAESVADPPADSLLGFHGKSGECHYCREYGRKKNLTRDHIIPRSRGGRTDPSNLVWACSPCNFRKGSTLPTCRCDHCTLAVLLHIEYVKGIESTSMRRLMLSALDGLDPYYERRFA